jgi:WS/DGAT/MGAT family acyltransferase
LLVATREPARVGVLDAAFLDCETAGTPMHIGGLLVFDGEPEVEGRPGAAGLIDSVAQRLPLLPRLRQRLQPVPWGLGDPIWVDDAGFDIGHHVFRRPLPRPGRESQLWDTVADLHARPLDRRRPLWELHLIEGLADGRAAVYAKLHHAMVDGLAAVQLGLVVLDADPGAPTASAGSGGLAADAGPTGLEPPPASELLAAAVRERLDRTSALLREGVSRLGRPRDLARRVREELGVAGTMRALASLTRPAPRTPFNPQAVGARRRLGAVRVSLATAKEIKNAFGATVNDVVLAIIAEALHGFLRHRGEDVAGTTCRVLVPVANRRGEQAMALGNGLGGLFVDLPVGPVAPALRLRTIARRVAALKRGPQTAAAERIVGLASLAPPPLRALGLRAALRQQRVVNLVVSNVPGVQVPLYAGGARLREIYPLLPLGPNLGLSVCVFSYADVLHFGLVADASAFPDLTVLEEGITAGAERLRAAAGEALAS